LGGIFYGRSFFSFFGILFVLFFLIFFDSSGDTDAVDQAALVAILKGFTYKGKLDWNTANGLCGQDGVKCTDEGKVTRL